MGLLHAALRWLLFGFEDTGSLDVRIFIHGRYPKNAHVGPSWPSEEKGCVLLLIQTKFQSYCCPLIIVRDFGTLFLWGRAGKAFLAKGTY